MKYVEANAPDSEIASQYADAEAQILQYAGHPRLLRTIQGCTLHGIAILFRGPTIDPPKQILEKEV